MARQQGKVLRGTLATEDQRKATGSHYTPRQLAQFVAKQIVRAARAQGSTGPLVVADPAIGDGELVVALLDALPREVLPSTTLYGFETDTLALDEARRRLSHGFPDVSQRLVCGSFLEYLTDTGGLDVGPTLFMTGAPPERFDLVIANPPYVRTQVMGAKRAQALSRKFGLKGRLDLYFAFLLGLPCVLKPGGIAGVIVSNRFMTTRAGKTVREVLLEDFDVLHIWDLGDTKLFEASVLPAVLLLRRKGLASTKHSRSFTSIYSVPGEVGARRVPDVLSGLDLPGVVEVPSGDTYSIRHGILEAKGVWRLSNDDDALWLRTVESRTHCQFGTFGKVRVGVKTTADEVFVRNDWHEFGADERPELLRPLTTHRAARPYRPEATVPEWQILYTHEVVQGKRVPVDLSRYPRTAAYLERFRSKLESRKYVIDAGRRWYEIWVPQDPAAWSKPKIVLRDIASEPVFWLDETGTVVNGDCYWIDARPGSKDDFAWLVLAVGNSTFATEYYDRLFNNRLYSNRRRFMTQYVERFPLPDPGLPVSRTIIALAKEVYKQTSSPEGDQLRKQIEPLVWEAFGLSVKER